MDLFAILGPPAGAVADAPATGAATAAPDDAFAAMFATAMGETETVPAVGSADAPAFPTLPAPNEVGVPVVASAPNASVPVVLGTSEVPKTPQTPAPSVDPPKGELPIPDEAPPVETGGERPNRPPSRPRPQAEAPPEPPPPLDEAPAPSEKEAPTTAPNAPVPPLDLSSEKADEPREPTSVGSPMVAPASVTAVADEAPDFVAASAVGAIPSPSLSAKPAGKGGKPLPESTKATKPSGEETSKPTPSTQSPIGDRNAVSPPEESSFTFTPSVANLSPKDTAASRDAAAPSPQDVPNAPDLGVATPVVEAAVAQTSVATKAVPNERVAKVAAGGGNPPVAEKAETTGAKTAAVETAVVREDAAPGDDAPADDSPPDATPQASAPATAKTVATERPEAGADRPSVDRHLVVRQVADRIESLVAARPKDGVTIHLEPRDLGTLTLVVKGLSSALDVQVSASDERVRQGLDASRPELAQALAPRGIELRELRLSYAPTPSSPSSSTGGDAQGGSNPEGRPRPQTPASFVNPSRKETPAPRTSRSRGRGVDLLV